MMKDETIMCQFTDELRENLFIQIPKYYFECFLWMELPLASKAILPVILKHMNAQKTCFPGQKTIAYFAGITQKTVREGLKGLRDLPGFYKEKYVTRRGHTSYKYKLEVIDSYQETISINHSFFNGENWSQLTPVAKAVYPVLKHFAWWKIKIYEKDEYINHDIGGDPSIKNYPDRLYDYANPEPEIVAEYAGVNIRSLKGAYTSLSKHHFIEFHGKIDDRDTWKLFTSLPEAYQPQYLDAQDTENFTY